ncbi:MAG: thioesterase family protein [Thermoprotei archaeon]
MSEYNIPEGIACKQEYIVEEKHTAKHIGSGTVEVLSTPSMILFMENTALNCVQKYLPEGYTTVGIRVDVKHLNPAPLGGRIVVEARVNRVEGKKIVFSVKAYWKDIVIGEGIHERYIVNVEKFLDKVNRLLTNMGGEQ